MKDQPDKNVPLNFSTTKHDARVEQSKLTEEEARLKPQQRRVKKKALTIMQSWTKRVKSKPLTPAGLIQATYQLQTLIGELGPEAKRVGLEEWHQFSMSMIEDKIATLVSTGITAKNEIVPYIPQHPTMLDDDNDRIVREQLVRDAKPVQFRTLDELNALPFVAAVRAKGGFVGLLLQGKTLVAFFKDGDTVPVGYLANGVGLDKIPTLEDYVAALAASSEPGSTDPSSASDPGAHSAGAPDSD